MHTNRLCNMQRWAINPSITVIAKIISATSPGQTYFPNDDRQILCFILDIQCAILVFLTRKFSCIDPGTPAVSEPSARHQQKSATHVQNISRSLQSSWVNRDFFTWWVELLWVHILLPGYPLTNTQRVPVYPFNGWSMFSALKQDQYLKGYPGTISITWGYPGTHFQLYWWGHRKWHYNLDQMLSNPINPYAAAHVST